MLGSLLVLAVAWWWLGSSVNASAAASACTTEVECRRAVQHAVTRVQRCLWSCSAEMARVAETRAQLKRLLEAEAAIVQVERQRSFDARRERERERQQDLSWQREKEALTIAHRQRLELLEVRAAAERAAAAARQDQQVAYLKLLTPEQRRARLEQCRRGRPQCDALAELLVRAAASQDEIRTLVDQNEAPIEATSEAS
jgi:hypothetical protein